MTNNIDTVRYRDKDDESLRSNKRVGFGIAMILIGGLFLLERLGYIPDESAGNYWPILICVFGLNKLLFAQYTYRKIKGALQIFLGFWVFACLNHVWGWTFSMTWPMILIAVGLCYIGPFLFKNNK